MARAHFRRAHIYRERREFDKALADYSSPMAWEPGAYDVYLNRGYPYEERGEKSVALADYKSAAALKGQISGLRVQSLKLGNVKFREAPGRRALLASAHQDTLSALSRPFGCRSLALLSCTPRRGQSVPRPAATRRRYADAPAAAAGEWPSHPRPDHTPFFDEIWACGHLCRGLQPPGRQGQALRIAPGGKRRAG